MNDRIIILSFLIFTFAGTIFLYLWKAKKQVSYKNDERWQVIQNKANRSTNGLNWALIVFIGICSNVSFFQDYTFSFSRLMTIALIYFGIHNVVELFSLLYFDKKL